MPKPTSEYSCTECGGKAYQYFGKCPSCGAWGTLVEQTIVPAPPSSSRRTPTPDPDRPSTPRLSRRLEQIVDYPQQRLPSGYGEFDRVLGGGIVPGSLVLIGGDPGIGKSTLLLQVARHLSEHLSLLYVCAEESGQQVKMRWQRLQEQSPATAFPPHLYLLPEVELEKITVELESLKPTIAVIDSIQAIYFATLNSAPGSVSQVRECTSALMRLAKQLEIALLIVGHVTKEGAIAGPKVLEHLVDTVLYFEGDRFASHRLLRSVKNRFGATHELGIFEMQGQGLIEVPNPSALFLGNRLESVPGTATIVACEGTRPLLVELQALVSPTSYPSPRRSTTGMEYNRLLQILAVLEKRVGFPLSKFDAYVASAGGLSVTEPAADLGIAVAIAASFRDRTVAPDLVLIGEVGLGGQIRPVSQLDLRLKEAAKLGFRTAIVPQGQNIEGSINETLTLHPVAKVVDALSIALQPSENLEKSPGNGD
ncbi:MAG: DNA repair protein RadA [Prochlorotrichaceae cyanobacterium]